MGEKKYAKREKVLVLKNLQQFEEATELAKENDYSYSENPYHIQAFFECLINTYSKVPDRIQLAELLCRLGRIQSEKAQSMYGRCKALYFAYVDQEYDAALREIDKVIAEFPKDKKYALTVKFEIALKFREVDVKEAVIKKLEEEKSNSNYVVICKSKLMAVRGDVEGAVKYFSASIAYFPEKSKAAFYNQLRGYGYALV